MATIQQALALYDGVSPVLHQIGRAVDQTIGKFTRTAGAATNMEKAAAQGAQGVANAVTGVSAPISNLGTKVDVVSAKMRNVGGGTFNGVTNAVNTALGPIRKLGSAIDEIRAKLQGARASNGAFSGIANAVDAASVPIRNLDSRIDMVNAKLRGAGNGAFSGMQNASRVGANGIKSSVNSCNRAMMGFGSTIDIINSKLRSAGKGAFAGLQNAARAGANNIRNAMTSVTSAIDTLSSHVDNLNTKLQNAGRGAFKEMQGALSGLIGQIAMGNILADMISSAGRSAIGLVQKLVSASDEYAGIQARLKLVAGDAEKAAQMNEQIYQSALRARGSYTNMADSVAKIAMTAKEAFPKPQDVVPFVEGIQKLFVIGGTSAEQAKNAMLQLTQALGSGRLQGDEFRSIAEAAPLIEQMVAKTMGVSQGALKQLAAEGEVTAEIIKRAIFENMSEIDEMFSKMPMTWGQRFTILETKIDHAFNAVKERLNFGCTA